MEAGVSRDLVVELQAVGIGAIAERLDQAGLTDQLLFTGFISNKTRSVRSLVFHITDFKEFRKD